MGHSLTKDVDFGGAVVSSEEIAKGSVGVSAESHAFLVGLVHDIEKPSEDRPFESIVEAFRFAFALGYRLGQRQKKEGKSVTVAPRQFVVTEYLELLRDEIEHKGGSLGGIISEYAEAGCDEMANHMAENQDLTSLI